MKRLSLFLSNALDLPLEFSSSELVNDQQGTEKQTQILGQKQPENEALEVQENDTENTNQDICLDTSISFQAVEDLPWQPSSLGEYRQLSLWKSMPTLNSSCDRTSQEFQSTPISETTTQNQENSICYRWDFPAQARVTQEAEQDYLIQNQHFGEKDLDALLRPGPNSVLSNNLKELSDEDFELFLADSLWQDTITRLKQSRQQSLERVIKDEGFLLFPTLTSGASTTTSRPAGQTKCEKWFKDNGLIPNGSQLGTKAIASIMGFPYLWFKDLTKQYSKSVTIPSQVKHQEESQLDISQEEVSHQDKPRSHSAESSISQKLLGGDENSPLQKDKRSSPSREISIPCLVKQPKQSEVKGVINQDLGDRFVVDISDELITVSKLFVYPDFSESVGQIGKCSSKTITPSKNCSSKKRRPHGFGSGHIYYRTVTRNGKNYQQAYYQWRENGQQRTKYIPKKLLTRVEEAEASKLPVGDILVLLGGIDKCSSKKFDTLIASNNEKVPNCSNECSSKTVTPSKKRKKGYGTGYIECKPIKRSGKEYQQYWYHYEFWREGDRITKKSKYIPNNRRSQIEKMNDEKAPVEEILKVLSNRGKRKK